MWKAIDELAQSMWFGQLYWIIVWLWLVLAVWLSWPVGGKSWRPLWRNLLLFILLLMIGWILFGMPF